MGNNMFAYCRNNPVCRRDISGATDEKCYEGASDPLGDDEELTGGKMGNNGDESPTERIGGGHGNPVHKEQIENHMRKLEKLGRYSKLFGNRALKTAGLVGNQRPDVIGVRYDGLVEVWEFASPSQALGTPGYTALETKISVMQAANPTAVFYPIILP